MANKDAAFTPTVIIPQSESAKIKKFTEASPRGLETGGDLWGFWDIEKGHAYVMEVTGPGPNARPGATCFYQDPDFLLETHKQMAKLGYDQVGCWHSHHTLGLKTPSGGDCNTAKECFVADNLDAMLMIIATLNKEKKTGELKCQWIPYLFTKPNTSKYATCNVTDMSEEIRMGLVGDNADLLDNKQDDDDDEEEEAAGSVPLPAVLAPVGEPVKVEPPALAQVELDANDKVPSDPSDRCQVYGYDDDWLNAFASSTQKAKEHTSCGYCLDVGDAYHVYPTPPSYKPKGNVVSVWSVAVGNSKLVPTSAKAAYKLIETDSNKKKILASHCVVVFVSHVNNNGTGASVGGDGTPNGKTKASPQKSVERKKQRGNGGSAQRKVSARSRSSSGKKRVNSQAKSATTTTTTHGHNDDRTVENSVESKVDGNAKLLDQGENECGGYVSAWVVLPASLPSTTPSSSKKRANSTLVACSVNFFPRRTELFARARGLLEVGALWGKGVVAIGVGSGNSPCVMDLVRSGVGRFLLVDFDRMEPGNAARHVCDLSDCGRRKIHALADLMRGINPWIEVQTLVLNVVDQHAEATRKIVEFKPDLMLIGTDNFESRRFMNKIAVEEKIPAIVGRAMTRAAGGDVVVIRPYQPDFFCMQCIFSQEFLENDPKANDMITSVEQQRNAPQYVPIAEKEVQIQVGLSCDIAPISNMMTKLSLVELSRGTNTGLCNLDRDLAAPYFMWCNRRDPKLFSDYRTLNTNPQRWPVPLRWYPAHVERKAPCVVCQPEKFYSALGSDTSNSTNGTPHVKMGSAVPAEMRAKLDQQNRDANRVRSVIRPL